MKNDPILQNRYEFTRATFILMSKGIFKGKTGFSIDQTEFKKKNSRGRTLTHTDYNFYYQGTYLHRITSMVYIGSKHACVVLVSL